MMVAAYSIAFFGSRVPSVSNSTINLSKSVLFSNLAFSTVYATLRTGLKEASTFRAPTAVSSSFLESAGSYPLPVLTVADKDKLTLSINEAT